jgi:hypothetical protein
MNGASRTVKGSRPPRTCRNTVQDSAADRNSRPVETAMAGREPPRRQNRPARMKPSSGAKTSAVAIRPVPSWNRPTNRAASTTWGAAWPAAAWVGSAKVVSP